MGVNYKTDINTVVHEEVQASHVSSRSERQLTTTAALRRSSCCLAAVNALAYVNPYKFLLASNLAQSLSISSQFTLLQSKMAKKSLKTNIFLGSCHLSSSMLTFLKSSSLVLVITSSMSVHVCNYFHARQANNG